MPDSAVSDSPLVQAHARVQARRDLEKQLAAANARVAELEARMPGTPATAAAIKPIAPAPVDVGGLWDRLAGTTDPVARYDLALGINAAASGEPVPESIATPAGRAARIAKLETLHAEAVGIRAKSLILIQLSDLQRGSIPAAESALSEDAKAARCETLRGRLDLTTCPKERYRIVGLMPR